MNIFNYESKFNQTLQILADMIILNILFVLCSIPLFTIGAAQAGLFTGLRVLLDKEDDSSPAKAFFRGFSNGFKRITIVSNVYALIMIAIGYFLYLTLVFMFLGGSKLPVILCIAAICVVYILHSISGPFHATFGCTTRQLFRNCFFVTMAYPLHAIITAALSVLPLVVFFIWPQIIIGGFIALVTMYYSAAYLLIFTILKAPFQALKDDFYAAQEARAVLAEETNTPEEETESIN